MSYGQLQRWRASARSSVVGGSGSRSRFVFRFAAIERGWRVEDSDGRLIGSVLSADPTFLVISRGVLARKLFVPLSAIAIVHEGAVRLNVTGRWALAKGWDRPGRRNSR
jgi:hypothetical protein